MTVKKTHLVFKTTIFIFSGYMIILYLIVKFI